MPRPTGSRTSSKDRLARRAQIETLLAQDVGQHRIGRMIAEQFGVSTRQARKDLAEVLAEWDDESRIPAHRQRAHRRKVLEALYRSCLARKDLRAAVATQALLCKIDGVFAPETTILVPSRGEDGEAVSIADMPTSHQRGRLAELMAKAQADRARLPAASGPFIEAGSTAPRPRERTATATPVASQDEQDAEPSPAPQARPRAAVA